MLNNLCNRKDELQQPKTRNDREKSTKNTQKQLLNWQLVKNE